MNRWIALSFVCASVLVGTLQTSVGESLPAVEASPESTPVMAGNSVDTPAGIGDTIKVDQWEVTLVDVSDQRRERGLITASLNVTNVGQSPSYVFGRFEFGIAGADGVGQRHDDECSSGATYENDAFFSDVFPGGTARATLCWQQDALVGLRVRPVILYVHAINLGSDVQAYYYFDLTRQGSNATPITDPMR